MRRAQKRRGDFCQGGFVEFSPMQHIVRPSASSPVFVSSREVSTDTSFSTALPFGHTRLCNSTKCARSRLVFHIGPPAVQTLWLYNNMIQHSVATCGVLSLKCDRMFIMDLLRLYFWVEQHLDIIWATFFPMMHIAESDNHSGMLERSLEYFTHKTLGLKSSWNENTFTCQQEIYTHKSWLHLSACSKTANMWPGMVYINFPPTWWIINIF